MKQIPHAYSPDCSCSRCINLYVSVYDKYIRKHNSIILVPEPSLYKDKGYPPNVIPIDFKKRAQV